MESAYFETKSRGINSLEDNQKTSDGTIIQRMNDADQGHVCTQPDTLFIDAGAIGILVYRKEISTTTKSNHSRMTFLTLPLEIRRKIYGHVIRGKEIDNVSMVPRMRSQIEIGFVLSIPGAGLFLACKQLRQEAKEYLYNTIHFSAKWCVRNGFTALHTFRWGSSVCMVESIDLHTRSIMNGHPSNLGSKLDFVVSRLPALRYLRVSTSFFGDEKVSSILPGYGSFLIECRRDIQAVLLRFGAFVTLRHPSLKILAWALPTGDVRFVGKAASARHLSLKLVATAHDLVSSDTILDSALIRQFMMDELLSMEAEDFKLIDQKKPSEWRACIPLPADSTRSVHNSVTSGVETLAYLPPRECKQIGLKQSPNFDVLIEQARTGSLDAQFSAALEAAEQLAIKPDTKEFDDNLNTKMTAHTL